MILQDEKLLAFGSNSRGQLGISETMEWDEVILNPTPVSFEAMSSIKSMKAEGFTSSVLIENFNMFYVWGEFNHKAVPEHLELHCD